MSDNSIKLTVDEANLAAAQEESERLTGENARLQQRVVFLRALVNRLQGEQKQSETKQPQDRRRPAKKP